MTRDGSKIKPEIAHVMNESNGPGMSGQRPRSMSPSLEASVARADSERRTASDRRKRTLHAIFYGSLNPRRRNPRRTDARSLRDVDWHEPRWMAVAVVILVLSSVDAALTLILISQGAYEINPIMAPFIGGSPLVFTLVKVGLTGGGVVLLTLAVRIRAFGRIPVSLVLYAMLLGYGVLVLYELWLLGGTSLTV